MLIEVARRLRLESRDTDTFARIGGEEFAIILQAHYSGKAIGAAERTRNVIAAIPVVAGDEYIEVKASVGVAMLRQGDPSPEVLVQRADAALYTAKAAGRDRVIVAAI